MAHSFYISLYLRRTNSLTRKACTLGIFLKKIKIVSFVLYTV
ncbi:hypothetical protein GCWU000325_00602 [Alloprevotella tannerae ATCC 51259]|uniref:Uncharacterized protein n=1 Tax=Alloprevotella tannerae ATCC 51259 TaxID=626522 RepID=C9LEH6_9BACT|nr:hypothetical protein GCWU000325_00602 [Alloprevotella tannerae ATCC 51259]